MSDMLVNLYQIRNHLIREDTEWQIRKVLPPEKHVIVEWVREHFSEKWASECEVACSKTPASCFIAVCENEILGFACYDTTFRNFFGPTGVKEAARGKGIGYQLLLFSLLEMKHKGYAYAVIGDAGPIEFYQRAVGRKKYFWKLCLISRKNM